MSTPISVPFVANTAVGYKAISTGSLNRHNEAVTTYGSEVTRYIIGSYTTDSNDEIGVAYSDRTVTHLTVMVPDPDNWHDGDQVKISNIWYVIVGDVTYENMGPFAQFNSWFGGHFRVQRVTG